MNPLSLLSKLKDSPIKSLCGSDTQKSERELKRKILELQVLRSLGERVGYSLDLRQILEVIVDSLGGLVDFTTVSYMLLSSEGQIIFKVHAAEAVPHAFLEQTRKQMLQALEVMSGKQLQAELINETLSGAATDDSLKVSVESFFNLPVIINGKVVALINVSSSEKGLYGDEETTILYTILTQVSSQASKLFQVIENEKRRLSAMISSLADGVMMVDPGFNLIVINSALYRLLGLQAEGEANTSGINLFHIVAAVGSGVDLQGAVKEALQKQTLVKIPEFTLGENALQIDVEPVKDKFGYLLGAVVVFHDVTAEKQLERLREDFTAMMVHELRTPLTTISYSTEMMITDMAKMTPASLEENLKVVKATTLQMLSLVSELLDVAKIEAGKFEVVKKPDDLKGLITEKITAFKPLADQKKLQLTAELDTKMITASFDRKRLGQVLDNLLSNAFKYTDRGRIDIKAVIEDKPASTGEVWVSISDSGDGIKPEDLLKLFSKFEQLGKGKSGAREGTGLGLVVSKGIVEAHGGKIWAESPGLGKGTTFTFSLPLTA